MRHQAKTEPFGLRQVVWEPDSIIGNGESKFAIIPGEANVDPLRGRMQALCPVGSSVLLMKQATMAYQGDPRLSVSLD